MGGRGASSGISDYGNPYGSQYHALMTSGNIKFVEKNGPGAETLMDTMTAGRVYVEVSNGEPYRIIYFDKNNKRTKQVDLKHYHGKGKNKIKGPHTQHGYEHVEKGPKKGATNPTTEERAMIDRVLSLWEKRR